MNLETLRIRLLEKYAGDETKVEAFLDGFAKEASELLMKQAADTDNDGDRKGRTKTFPQMLTEGFAESVSKGVGNVVVNGAMLGLGKIVNGLRDMTQYNDFLRAVEKARQLNKVVKNADREKVIRYGETVYKFAPHVACDANMLASILANAIQGDGIDPMTIRTLSELEAKYQDNTAFLPKTFN